MAKSKAGGVSKKKAAPGHAKISAKKEQRAWVNGTKDFDLDTVPSEAFRACLERDKQKQSYLTYAQITNAYYRRNAEFSSQARKVLKANDITPWTAQVGDDKKKSKQEHQKTAAVKPAVATKSTTSTQSVEQEPQPEYVLPNIRKSARISFLTSVLAASRAQRPDITLAEVLTWQCDSSRQPEAKARRRGLYDHLKANMKAHASGNDSCEDTLLHCIQLRTKQSKTARGFLWDIVHSRVDMHLSNSELKRMAAGIESDPSKRKHNPYENLRHNVDHDDDEEDHEEQTGHTRDANSEMDYEAEPALLHGRRKEHEVQDSRTTGWTSINDTHDTNSEMDYEAEPAPLHGRRKEHEEQDSRTASWKSINANAQELDKVNETSSAPLDKVNETFSAPLDKVKTTSSMVKKTSTAPSEPIQFWELTPEEQKKQTRYYGFEHPSDIVRCMTCGKKGHMSYNCVILCEVCGEQRAPGASHPPCRKCLRCRVRGHYAEDCTRPSVIAGAIGDECDLCGRGGHAEGECSRLWGVWEDVPEEDKVRAEDMPVPQCYCCCGPHWGDDCPRLPERIRERVAFDNSWSAAYFSRWIKDPTPPPRSGDHGPGSLPAYQLRMLNDFDIKLH